MNLDDFLVSDQIDEETFYTSIGTLGGGNHFISLEASEEGNVYPLIHSGSRNVGHTVATTYQTIADNEAPGANAGEGFVIGKSFEHYLHDLHLSQKYARQNRQAMRDNILKRIGLSALDSFDTVHNYIEVDTMIARKGAVSAKKGDRLVIPFNSRDGSVIAVGKGNEDWNFSAPHGAGRTMSRTQAKKQITLESYQKMMTGIYSSSVSKSTLDEAPLAYKKQAEILALSAPTMEVVERLKPIYNLK